MSSDRANDLKTRFTRREELIDKSLQIPRLVLASRADGTGPVEVLEEIDGKLQAPSGRAESFQRFTWPKRTEFFDVTEECVEKTLWSDMLRYQVSKVRESEKAGEELMEIWTSATEFDTLTADMDEAEAQEMADTLLKRHSKAYTAQRDAQERVRGVREQLGVDAYNSFETHLTWLQSLRPPSLGNSAAYNRDKGRTCSTEIAYLEEVPRLYGSVMTKLHGCILGSFDRGMPDLEELDNAIYSSQLRMVLLEAEIRDNKLKQRRDLDIVTSDDKGKQVSSSSEKPGGDEDETRHVNIEYPDATIGLDLVSSDTFRLVAFPRLQWNASWNATIPPYLSQSIEPPIPEGALRLDMESLHQLAIEFHLKEGEEVLPVRGDFQRALQDLKDVGAKWAESVINGEESAKAMIEGIGSSADKASQQAIHELLQLTRQLEDREVFVSRLPAVLTATFERFATVTRDKLGSSRSDVLERATTERSRQFATMWMDTLGAKVEYALQDGKSVVTRLSASVSTAIGSKSGTNKRSKRASKQVKSAREKESQASRLTDRAKEAATELGIDLPSNLTELQDVIRHLDERGDDTSSEVAIPTSFDPIPVDWHSMNQGSSLSADQNLAPSIAVSDLGSELSATTLMSDSVSDASAQPGGSSLSIGFLPRLALLKRNEIRRLPFHTDGFYTRGKESGPSQEERFEQLKANRWHG